MNFCPRCGKRSNKKGEQMSEIDGYGPAFPFQLTPILIVPFPGGLQAGMVVSQNGSPG